jgi:hypothetical protein
VEGDELVSRMHGQPNDIFGEAGFRSSGRVNDEIWNRKRLGHLLLFGQALRSSGLQRPLRPYRSSPRYRRAVPQPLGCGQALRRIEEARSSIESPPDLRTLRAEWVSFLSGVARITAGERRNGSARKFNSVIQTLFYQTLDYRKKRF